MRYLLFLLLLISSVTYSQSNVDFRGDSARFYKNGGSMEVVIRNNTRDSTNGVLTNIGNGVTKFLKFRVSNDSLFLGNAFIGLIGGGGGDSAYVNFDLPPGYVIVDGDTTDVNIRQYLQDSVIYNQYSAKESKSAWFERLKLDSLNVDKQIYSGDISKPSSSAALVLGGSNAAIYMRRYGTGVPGIVTERAGGTVSSPTGLGKYTSIFNISPRFLGSQAQADYQFYLFDTSSTSPIIPTGHVWRRSSYSRQNIIGMYLNHRGGLHIDSTIIEADSLYGLTVGIRQAWMKKGLRVDDSLRVPLRDTGYASAGIGQIAFSPTENKPAVRDSSMFHYLAYDYGYDEAYEIAYPDTLTFRPFQIYWDGTKAITGYDPEKEIERAMSVFTALYVDPTNGNNAAAGTSWATAKKDLRTAMTTSGKKVIYVKGGMHHRQDHGLLSATTTFHSDSTLIIGVGGPVRITAYELPSGYTWSVHSGTVYKAFQDSIHTVVDYKNLGPDGLPRRYMQAQNWQQVVDNAGYFYVSNDTVYVRAIDDRAPDDSVKLANNQASALTLRQLNDSGYVYMQNISFEGFYNMKLYRVSTSNTPKQNWRLKNIDLAYMADYGLFSDGNKSIYSVNCRYYKNNGDGANYENVSMPSGHFTNVIEMNCKMFDNGNWIVGDASNDAINGSSLHRNINAIRLNSSYYRNRGPNVSDINWCRSLVVGCTAYGSTSDGTGGQGRISDFSANNHTMYLYNSTAYGSLYSTYATAFPTFTDGKIIPVKSRLKGKQDNK